MWKQVWFALLLPVDFLDVSFKSVKSEGALWWEFGVRRWLPSCWYIDAFVVVPCFFFGDHVIVLEVFQMIEGFPMFLVSEEGLESKLSSEPGECCLLILYPWCVLSWCWNEL